MDKKRHTVALKRIDKRIEILFPKKSEKWKNDLAFKVYEKMYEKFETHMRIDTICKNATYWVIDLWIHRTSPLAGPEAAVLMNKVRAALAKDPPSRNRREKRKIAKSKKKQKEAREFEEALMDGDDGAS